MKNIKKKGKLDCYRRKKLININNIQKQKNKNS